jgi:hypothetical protein
VWELRPANVVGDEEGMKTWYGGEDLSNQKDTEEEKRRKKSG